MKILLYTDLTIREDELFWHRDLGLLTRAFRHLGHEAQLVVHPARESNIHNQTSPISKDPVIWASASDVRNPSWWQSGKPDLVILGLWTRPQYDPIRRAALSVTPHIIERADSDGMRTASCGLKEFTQRRYDYFRDQTAGLPKGISFLLSCLYATLFTLSSPWMEKRLAKSLRFIPDLVVETPGATLCWNSLVKKLKPATRVHHIPHPVQADLFRYRDSVRKEKKVVAVGRWETHQKNLPLLLSTLRAFLDRHPDWSAVVIGSGLPLAPRHPRITLSPPLPAASLAEVMGTSKIFLFSSRYESFLLSGAEALVAGCSVVGPETLVATQQLVEIQGCAPFGHHSLGEGLEQELQAWTEAGRNPSQISKKACAVFSAETIAQKFLSLAVSRQAMLGMSFANPA